MLSHTLKLSNTFKNAANITAYHTHAFIEKHCNWCDTSWCHQPPWPRSSNCPCHPQCGRTATKMTWRMPDMILSSITTAYHFLVEDNSNWSDTSKSQRPRWSSPPCCPCRSQCRRPPIHIYLMFSDMLQEEEKKMTTETTSAYHILVGKKFQPKCYILISATSLVLSFLLSLPSAVPSTTNSHEKK